VPDQVIKFVTNNLGAQTWTNHAHELLVEFLGLNTILVRDHEVSNFVLHLFAELLFGQCGVDLRHFTKKHCIVVAHHCYEHC